MQEFLWGKPRATEHACMTALRVWLSEAFPYSSAPPHYLSAHPVKGPLHRHDIPTLWQVTFLPPARSNLAAISIVCVTVPATVPPPFFLAPVLSRGVLRMTVSADWRIWPYSPTPLVYYASLSRYNETF
jgi:hypothetical protein